MLLATSQKMEAIPDATLEDEAEMPDWICTFHKWMLMMGKKEATARAYARQLGILFDDDYKSPQSMATQNYFDITKSSFRNKVGNGQRAASVKSFLDFFGDHIASGKPLADANGNKLYQVKGRSGGVPIKAVDFVLSVESNEEKQLRKDLQLPVDWSCSVRHRDSGDFMVAASPGGTAYNTREAIDKRLGRAPGGTFDAVADRDPEKKDGMPASSNERPAVGAVDSGHQDGKGRARSAAQDDNIPQAGAKRESSTLLKASKMARLDDQAEKDEEGKGKGKSKPVNQVDLASMVVRIRLLVGEAIQFVGISKSGNMLLVSGDGSASKPALKKIEGLYSRQEQFKDGRPVFQKIDAESACAVSFNEEKNVWSVSLTEKGKQTDLARVKDKAGLPHQVSKPWRLVKEDAATKEWKGFDEDTSIRFQALDPANLPRHTSVELVVKFPPPPQLLAKPPPRRNLPIAEAMKLAARGPVPYGAMHIDVAGADPSISGRIKGLYLREPKPHCGRSFYRKADEEKRTYLWFSDERASWRFSQDIGTFHFFAAVTDSAQLPSEIHKPWRVFDGEKSFTPEPSVKVLALDPKDLPKGLEVEVCC